MNTLRVSSEVSVNVEDVAKWDAHPVHHLQVAGHGLPSSRGTFLGIDITMKDGTEHFSEGDCAIAALPILKASEATLRVVSSPDSSPSTAPAGAIVTRQGFRADALRRVRALFVRQPAA